MPRCKIFTEQKFQPDGTEGVDEKVVTFLPVKSMIRVMPKGFIFSFNKQKQVNVFSIFREHLGVSMNISCENFTDIHQFDFSVFDDVRTFRNSDTTCCTTQLPFTISTYIARQYPDKAENQRENPATTQNL